MAENTNTPNFFLLLGLNPDEPWNQTKFEQAVREKRNEWSKQSQSVGIKALNAKKNLELLPQIQDVMSDPAKRGLQVEAARVERASKDQERLESFNRALAFAEKKGYLEQSEVDKLVTDFKDVLTEKDITSRIKVKVQAAQPQAQKEAQQLEPSLVKDIAVKLQSVNKTDLYDLLEMKQTSSNQLLSEAAEKLYVEMARRQPKTAEVTAMQALAGHAKDIFKTDEKRRRYDESRRLSKLSDLLKELDEVVNRSPKKELRGGQVPAFLDDAAKAGFNKVFAFEKLQAHARQRNWFVESPTIELSIAQIRCGNCSAMNDHARKFCFNCNRELIIACPDCGKAALSDEIGCANCGFPVGNRYWVSDLLDECRSFLDKRNIEEAEESLRKAGRAWSPRKPDALAQKILQYKTELQQLTQKRTQNATQLQQLINGREFYAARALLATIPPDALVNRQSYLQQVDAEIARAQELLRRAQALNASNEQKIDLCMQALRLCSDCKDARDLLSTMPPDPPRNVQARAGGAIVRLSWESSPTRGVSYKIVRKSRSQPVSVKDGTLLGTVSGPTFDDTQPEYGVPVFYAVFAAFENVLSTQAAILRTPLLLKQDVTSVVVRVDNQAVDISWKVPAYAYNVVVVRKERTRPDSPTDGKPIQLLDSSHLIDRDVQNGVVYFYGIYCQFKDFDGQVVSSDGLFQSATPEVPPAAITAFDMTSTKAASGHDVTLSWQSPAKGQAAALESKQLPSFKVGDTLSMTDIKQYGDVRVDRQTGLTTTVSRASIRYYTALVIFNGMAYIGATQRFVSIDDVSNLKYQNLGTILRLQWAWPENCQEVMVAYRHDDWPQTQVVTTNASKVTRAEYEYLGHYDIRGGQNQDYFIVVAALVRQSNELVVGSGARIRARMASKIVVEYEIKSKGLFGSKKRLLQIYVRTPGELPTLVMVSRQGRLPLNKAEGVVMHRVEGPLQIERETAIELPDRAFPPKTFGKLYLEDDSLYEVVTIHHPNEEKLRLS